MPGTMNTQNASTTTTVQLPQDQEASLVKQLATAEASLKSYEKGQSAMSSSERELNILVHQNRQQRVVELRGDLDALRQRMADVRAGVATGQEPVIARVQDGPLIVTDGPATVGTVEVPHFFGLEPRQFREPALFILLLPLILAFSRWIWRRTPARPNREKALEGNAQIDRLEQAVESIAIEVERIGEAQRFSAKLMAERPQEPVIERIREAVKAPRRVVTPLP
ncbi:hypothetical protein BH09GEM1_BH09GEM1_24960 [soil metagenome]